MAVPSEPCYSLAQLQDLITTIENRERIVDENRRKVEDLLTDLDSVLAIDRRDGREFPPLAACQDSARELRLQMAQWKGQDFDAPLQSRIQGFKSLLSMVRDGSKVGEDDRDAAYDKIENEFGAKLAIAVARGLIRLPERPTREIVPPGTTTSAMQSEAQQISNATQLPSTESPSELKPESNQTAPGVKTDVTAPPENGEKLPESHTLQSELATEPAVPQSRSELCHDSSFRCVDGETVKLLASEVLTCDQPFQPSAIQRLVWLTLAEDRVSTPYHLVRRLEILYPDSLSISSTLIRAFALGTETRMPLGSLATQLKSDIGTLVAAIGPSSTEQVFACHLMFVSAALCPAITAPDTSAALILEFRTAVDAIHEEIQTELMQSAKNASDIRVRGSVICCLRALRSLVSLLHPVPNSMTSEPEIKYVLSSELLLIPGLRLSPDWEPASEDQKLLRNLVEFLARGKVDWQDAFQKHSDEYRNHDATDRILEYLTWTGQHNSLVTKLSNEQATHVRQCQEALSRQIEECGKKIENGVALGLVRDKERSEFLQIVQKIRDRFSSIRDFGEAEADLARINIAIEKSRMVQVEAARRRLQAAKISSESPAFKRIMSVLDKGDVDTANEYIDLAASGANLPESGELKDVFSSFFPRAASEIDDFLSDPHQSGSLLSRIETQKGIPGVEMRNVPGAQVTEAIDLLEAWYGLKKTKRANRDQLGVLFERFGFEVLNLSEGTGHPRSWIALQTKTLGHRDQCPVPYFGSLADGNYRILCIWDRPSEKEIVNQLRSGRQGSPIVVLYFGRLTEQKRRDLARLSRADHLSFLMIDEVLIV